MTDDDAPLYVSATLPADADERAMVLVPEEPGWTTFIQYKNTELCMDFNCTECGSSNHYDAAFAHLIKCGGCSAVFQMPTDVPLRLVTARSPATFDGWTPVEPTEWNNGDED